MPISLDPAAVASVVLDGDKSKNPAPSFQVRHLTCRQAIERVRLFEQADQTDIGQLNAIVAAIKIQLVGWQNMGRDFNADVLLDILTVGEIDELSAKIREATTETPAEKKASGSSPQSGPEPSAKTA